ncbi:hypothetical protein BLI708_06645 [Bifidobacterium imperatoris]|uniref:Terminase n=1 Tax=Bifidobacterium imperatoris TaxID=2020965 RepID=A0A2N5IQW6_9BIFI|nr:hypothetical protein [Bifidobacterium imperatoris]PLS24347.1 hypothetical protein Tam1G_1610 [Bifidobacterium imperatoris]QSY56951.1 hypothetical protein BLI708_06645 [Bifidobacterium imperatoris]
MNHSQPPELKPRHATPRNPDRETDGALVARFSTLLGKPLIPWQRQVIDVISEIDPATGTYWYDELVLTVQRQAGKTTITKSYDVRNALWGPDRKTWYLAQTGKDANDQFRDFVKSWRKSRLRRLSKEPRMSNGSMSLEFRNGSELRPGGATEAAGHGVQGDLINVDEVWSLSKQQAKNLKDGFIPTTTTRLKLTGVRPQIWWTSTEGNGNSEYFNDRLDRLRAGDIPKRTAFFDFGIPFDADPEDLETIWAYHPGAGHLFDFNQLAEFRQQFDDDAEGWARAFGNIRDDGVTERAIDSILWADTTGQPVKPSRGLKLCFGVGVTMGAGKTIVAACIARGDRPPIVQIVKELDGTGQAPQFLRELQAVYRAPICIDRRGPSAALADVLASTIDPATYEPAYRLTDLRAADAITAPQSLVSALEQHAVEHAPDRLLDEQVCTAAKRKSGDAWLWNRNAGDVHAMEAMTMAYWGYMHLPAFDVDDIQVF